MTSTPDIVPPQGSLFDVELVGSGNPDPDSYTVTGHLTPNPDGVFPEGAQDNPVGLPAPDSALLDTLHQEAQTRRRSLDQTGRHSPLQRDGSYLHVRPGDVLPGYGIVRGVNPSVLQHAQTLEDQRLAGKRR